ncbi:hypothetical protein B0H17DRAFT_1185780 [Mycena rosella]|uniref:F-box domain-containing protein n=1 Tax=Mycena rosella TaxID=1033263 RepID=A0AAD7G3Z3_MYCRO|nr:hypothetical protein B0H17DRAFT_1185780 [Mycena rosella]
MSIAELEARIDTLSTVILQQKEVLADLERSKGALQRRLNGLRDPLGRLPVEISSEIFVQCLHSNQPPDTRYAPLLFLNVCNTWTDIALATAGLWTSIRIDRLKFDLASLLDAWLKRAGSRAASISLPHHLPVEIVPVLSRHAKTLQDLEMHHHDADIALVAAAGAFPMLKTLTIVGVDASMFGSSPSATLDMLRVCPNAVDCTLDRVSYSLDEDELDDEDMLVLPHMRHFKFTGLRNSGSSKAILPHLTLPGLETLFIALQHVGVQNFVQFLQRSSPPLQQIIVSDPPPEWSLDEMTQCFPLLSTLTHFKLRRATARTQDLFLTALADSPHLLPNLSNFTLRMRFSPAQPWYQHLLNVLFARSKHLHAVRIVWRFISQVPPEDVVVQLRQFVADGMSIHVGSESHNYI